MPRRTVTIASGRERLNALLTLEACVVGSWLFVILLTGMKRDLFLSLQELIARTATSVTLGELFLSIILALAILLVLVRRHLLGVFTSMLLGFLGFTGAVLFLGAELSFFLSVGLILFERMRRSFLSNNLLILFAVMFGAVPVGISYAPEAILFVLFLFCIYDVAGVFLSSFIPHLARKSIEYRIPLLFVAPRAATTWSESPNTKNSASILGAGDAFLPAFLLSSVTLFASPFVAIAVLLGALLGTLGNTILAMYIKTGIPALPLMTVGMIIAYYLAI